MTKAEIVREKIDKIEKEHLTDTKTFGYFIAISFETEQNRKMVEMGSNLTANGLLSLASAMVDKAERMIKSDG